MTYDIRSLPAVNGPSYFNPCKGVLSVVAPKAATNLCINPSFETDHDNWQSGSGGATLTRVTEPWSGAWGLRYQGAHLNYGHTTKLNLQLNQQVVISFYIKNKKTTASAMTVELYHSSTVRAQWQFIAQPGVWKRQVCYTIVPHTQSYEFRIVGSALDFVIDAVQVELVSGHSATTYFDGSMTGNINNSQTAAPQYAWLGKPHDSISVRSSNAANGGLLYNLQDELGYMVVGFQNGDNPALDNQTVDYFGTDGAALQDIIVPPRDLTVIGYIYGQTPGELHRKVSRFLSYFAQDTAATRQPKTFIYQNMEDNEPVGVPLTFSGVIAATTQIPLGNDLAVQCALRIRMLDPFFYGHDESTLFDTTAATVTGFQLARARELTTYTGTLNTTFLDQPGVVVGTIYAMAVSSSGKIYIGGDFTSIGGITVRNFAGYDPQTETFFTVGTNLATLFNGIVYAIACTSAGGVYVGGAFTTTDGLTTNRFTWFFESSLTWQRHSTGGAVYGLNNDVYAIVAKPQQYLSAGIPNEIYLGGAFTADNSGNSFLRILRYDGVFRQCDSSGGVNNGVNGTVIALAYNPTKNEVYLGGSFTIKNNGIGTLNRIAYMDGDAIATIQPYYTGVNSTVRAIYADPVDGTVYIGGAFTQTAAGSTLKYFAKFSGTVWSEVYPQFDPGVVAHEVYGIVPYRNGVLFMGSFMNQSTYNFNQFLWYNGQSVFPVPYGSPVSAGTPDFPRCAIVLRNGDLYIGGQGIDRSGVNATATNTGSAAAPMIWQINATQMTSRTEYQLRQLINDTQMVSISLNQYYVSQYDYVEVDTGSGDISSWLLGDITRYVLSASGITNMRCLPGRNYLTIWLYDASSANQLIITAYWRQTFNALFDGARAI